MLIDVRNLARMGDKRAAPGNGGNCSVTFGWPGGGFYCAIGGASSHLGDLMRLIVGLPAPNGRWTAEVRLNGMRFDEFSDRELARTVALIPGTPHLVFTGIRRTLRAEMGLTLQWLGVDQTRADELCEECSRSFGIRHLLDRNPSSLSGGEAMLGAIAVAVVKQPRLVVFDGVYDFLDADHRQLVHRIVTVMARAGAVVVEAHVRAPEWIDEAAECLVLTRNGMLTGPYATLSERLGRVEPNLLPAAATVGARIRSAFGENAVPLVSRPTEMARALDGLVATGLCPADRQVRSDPAMVPTKAANPNRSVALCARRLRFRYPGSSFELGPIDLVLRRGELLAALGANGAGKTTLLRTLALLNDHIEGDIEVVSESGIRSVRPQRKPHLWAASVQCCFQNPDDQIYMSTVADELSDMARRFKRHDPVRMEYIARRMELWELRNASPFAIPLAMRRMLTLGSAFAARPPVLLLDEPTAHLDLAQVECLGELIKEYLTGGGAAIVVSHDHDFVASHATRLVTLENGRIITDAPVGQRDGSEHYRVVPTVARIGEAMTPPLHAMRASELEELVRRRQMCEQKNLQR